MNFTEKTDALKNAMDEIAGSISTITDAISEGAKGVNGAAESTQLLVVDMEKISSRMDKNAAIAKALQKRNRYFYKLLIWAIRGIPHLQGFPFCLLNSIKLL